MKASRIIIMLAAAATVATAGAYVAFRPDPMPPLANVQIGQAAPGFRLTDVNGRGVSLADFRGKTVVLEWNNPKCPFVRKHYESGNMQMAQATATAQGVIWLTINSSGDGKQGHMTPAEAKAVVEGQGSRRTAYLLDPTGEVGIRYGAKTTPHMYIVNPEGTLVYEGGIDDKPTADQDDIPGARNHVLAALGEMKAGKPVSVPTSRPYGCNVKYKMG